MAINTTLIEENMLEIIILGRGGQGAQTAGSLLAKAFFVEGKEVQAFATYGGARRGAPVSSSIRVDDVPIRLRCNIDSPNAILCFDDSLLDEHLLSGVTKESPIVVCSNKPPEQFKSLGDYNILTIDAVKIAQDNSLGRFINSALLGAFVLVLDSPSIESMRNTIIESAPVKKDENASACLDGYNRMQQLQNAA